VARRKRKEDVPIWEPPEFDEVGYMRKEIESAKISVVVVAWAVVGAILAYLFYALNLPIVGFLLGLLVFAGLYFLLPMLGLPIHGFKRRDWASHAMVYFFSWLAFSILLLNAPFGDHTTPVVGSFEVGSSNITTPGARSIYCFSATPGTPARVPATGNATVYVIFRATDNVGIRDVMAQVDNVNATPTLVADQPSVCVNSATPTFLPNTYSLTFPNPNTGFVVSVSVTAVDTSGQTAKASIQIAWS